jgi:DoxX-like family
MPDNLPMVAPSKAQLWIGRILSAIMVLFLAMDATMKFFMPKPVVDASIHLGLPLPLTHNLAYILFGCVLLYAIPQTSILGAILLVGYLGGAVSTHLRAGDPLFTHALFPVYFGIVIWLGLYLRDPRLRALVPFRS